MSLQVSYALCLLYNFSRGIETFPLRPTNTTWLQEESFWQGPFLWSLFGFHCLSNGDRYVSGGTGWVSRRHHYSHPNMMQHLPRPPHADWKHLTGWRIDDCSERGFMLTPSQHQVGFICKCFTSRLAYSKRLLCYDIQTHPINLRHLDVKKSCGIRGFYHSPVTGRIS